MAVLLLLLLLVVALAVLTVIAIQFLEFRKRSAQLDAELRSQKRKYDDDIEQWSDQTNTLKDHIKQWSNYANNLKVENERLAKWKGIADADAKAAELVKTAQLALDKANADASQLVADAQQRANTLVATAQDSANTISAETRQQTNALKDEAHSLLDFATKKAAQIVEGANKRAEEIAGSAYDAMKNASLYEQTAAAMKNIIEGYGNEYIIPERSLLDDLAEDFGHTEAGQKLKQAREYTRLMISNGTASTCDYVEANRRDTAVSFVLDAFNGKVDSILSRVKHDNAGKLKQEIRDAFTLVNFNGKAFRNARITEEYLAARLEELKWACIAQQLLLDEREEQRRIKEQMREEEKAHKEYERAMKDAAKEEEMLRGAMQKAQQQIEQATAEQRTKYEHQLQELTQKLKEAEERNQRAISMAQQTKRGHVYIISNVGSFGENIYKRL
jgi:hypothetical protein